MTAFLRSARVVKTVCAEHPGAATTTTAAASARRPTRARRTRWSPLAARDARASVRASASAAANSRRAKSDDDDDPVASLLTPPVTEGLVIVDEKRRRGGARATPRVARGRRLGFVRARPPARTPSSRARVRPRPGRTRARRDLGGAGDRISPRAGGIDVECLRLRAGAFAEGHAAARARARAPSRGCGERIASARRGAGEDTASSRARNAVPPPRRRRSTSPRRSPRTGGSEFYT